MEANYFTIFAAILAIYGCFGLLFLVSSAFFNRGPVEEYRVVEYYHEFFAHTAYRLEGMKRDTWCIIENDSLGINGHKWADHYHCDIIEATP